ncbi:unnamed protein product, partial [Ixodes persulcatus]
MPREETLKWTTVGTGGGEMARSSATARRTAWGPVRDSMSMVHSVRGVALETGASPAPCCMRLEAVVAVVGATLLSTTSPPVQKGSPPISADDSPDSGNSNRQGRAKGVMECW